MIFTEGKINKIEFFEVKYLAIISGEVQKLLREQNIIAVGLPHLEEVVSMKVEICTFPANACLVPFGCYCLAESL